MRPAATDNPVNVEVCPTLCRLVARPGKPIDACLGVEGLPQSATGQATMFTGVNCPQAMGRHCEGFPGPSLRAIIQTDNIFKSVTTVMALTVPETISTLADVQNDRALMQDLTRETIQDRYPDIPVITPQRAAVQLYRLAAQNDFTLYEFFQTDVSGHSMDYARACAVLRTYDTFLMTLVRFTEAAGITLVMTADHGNIENMSERGHTRNPVPFIVYGPGERAIRARVASLADVTPALLAAYDGKPGAAAN